MNQQNMECIFYLGPRFGPGPKRAPKLKMDSSYSFWARTFILSGIIGYPWTNKIIYQYTRPQNWKMDSSYSFWARILNSSVYIHLTMPKKMVKCPSNWWNKMGKMSILQNFENPSSKTVGVHISSFGLASKRGPKSTFCAITFWAW